jgi:hypothetical protein
MVLNYGIGLEMEDYIGTISEVMITGINYKSALHIICAVVVGPLHWLQCVHGDLTVKMKKLFPHVIETIKQRVTASLWYREMLEATHYKYVIIYIQPHNQERK